MFDAAATSPYRLPHPRPTWGRHALVLVGWFAIVALAVGWWRDVPLIDDWTYAWTVEQLMHTGGFEVLDWSSAYPLSQAVWGALWSSLLGFSFATLRLSTLALAAGGCVALYLLLRELDASPRVALVGALALAVNPVFVFLSSSFMTDVPFTSLTIMALFCYVRAIRRDEPRLVWWAGAWAFAAFLVRQVGIVIPVAALPMAFFAFRSSSPSRWRVTTALGVTWVAMAATWLLLRSTLGTTSIMARWSYNLYAQPSSYLGQNVPVFVVLAFYVLPAILAAASVHGVWRRPIRLVAAVAIAAPIVFWVVGSLPSPLMTDHTWTALEIGSSRSLVAGAPTGALPWWLDVTLRAAALGASALLALLCLSARRDRAIVPLLAFLAGYLVLMNLLWMYHDRYTLPLMPIAIALLLGSRDRPSVSLRPAVIALMLFGGVALIGARDALRYNQGVRDAWQSLIDAGVPPSDIDAGYAWNGWTLYAHPANLAPGQTPLKDVPWVTSARRTPYVISQSPLEGYTVEREIWWRDLPFARPERLLVLRQHPADAAGGG